MQDRGYGKGGFAERIMVWSFMPIVGTLGVEKEKNYLNLLARKSCFNA